MLTWAVNIYKSCVLGNATVLCIYLCSNLTTTGQKFAAMAGGEMFREAFSNLRKFISLPRMKIDKVTFPKASRGWTVRKADLQYLVNCRFS